MSKVRPKMCKDLHVKYCRSCQMLTKLEFSRLSLEKYKNIKFRYRPVGTEIFHTGE
jgi:hypothetical protein